MRNPRWIAFAALTIGSHAQSSGSKKSAQLIDEIYRSERTTRQPNTDADVKEIRQSWEEALLTFEERREIAMLRLNFELRQRRSKVYTYPGGLSFLGDLSPQQQAARESLAQIEAKIANLTSLSDMRSVLDLNLDAASVWQKIEDCQVNQNSYERPVIALKLLKKEICSDPVQDRALKLEIRNYRTQIQSYLASTAVIFDPEGWTHGINQYPRVHPLFTQIVLLELNSPQASSTVRENAWNSLTLIRDVNCDEWGLWPTANARYLMATIAPIRLELRSPDPREAAIWTSFSSACRGLSIDGARLLDRWLGRREDPKIFQIMESLSEQLN